MTVYYAHPIALYHTPTERGDLKTLRALGLKVINPAAAKYRALDMDGFVKLALSADLIAFRAFDDGKIGSGVMLEIERAREKGIPVIEMSGDLRGRALSRNETRARMGLPALRHPKTAPFGTVSDGFKGILNEIVGDPGAGWGDEDWGGQ